MNDKCKLCRYVIADTHARGAGYLCTNQDSPHFGHPVGMGCDGYKRFDPKPNISFKDALETLVMLPKGAYNDYFFKFGKADECSRPFYCISFTDNNQMFEWRDAVMRCFEELMKLKKESGDFKEGNQDERM